MGNWIGMTSVLLLMAEMMEGRGKALLSFVFLVAGACLLQGAMCLSDK